MGVLTGLCLTLSAGAATFVSGDLEIGGETGE
jgi:hypothetical protein